MPLAPPEMQFAMADARERHKATVDVIAGIDRQALSFLQLYVTLAGASLSGGGVVLLGATPNYPAALGIGLLVFAVPLVIGAILCIVTIWPADINLPGRDPDFWLWAAGDSVPMEHAFRTYLETLDVKMKQNRKLNVRMSNLMLSAKIAGIVAPVAGFVVAIIATQPI